MSGVVLRVILVSSAFSGFSNPPVLIVALVLIASRAFENSGALGLFAKVVVHQDRSVVIHIATMGGLGAVLSAVINNVAALAMLMRSTFRQRERRVRPPGLTLMPLAFASILGGMVTLIGTPPNIIASAVREQQLGAPYGMFDFSPVGVTIAVSGLLFVALIGWRLVPRREDKPAALDPSSFRAELLVPEESKLVDRACVELDEEAEEADVLLVGLIRDGRHHRGSVRATTIRSGDRLVVEGSTEAIAAFIKAIDLQKFAGDREGVGYGAIYAQ
ncbi:SLC13 family permease [Aminobacter aminovorans]|uniref:Di/tricarboxylate transporter n=1 Tax=Aminobacter aminovorans TaxID=83263 RepID=A0ABR6HGU7_AMIAI|nr:SLC13 family permease [Aminobacter aminovorans]MBB3709771.1 di/tricarboxylate transporter [Aminobacter aminovorans]